MYNIDDNVFLLPTPAGAFFAVSSATPDLGRKVVLALMADAASPKLNLAALSSRLNDLPIDELKALLYHLQTLGYVQALPQAYALPTQPLEAILPTLLVPLSSTGKALLADSQGFYIATTGFAHETAEEVSALSADLAALHARHTGLLEKNLGLTTSSWGLIDGAGNSQLGLWPLHVGEYRFVLALAGMPLLNQTEFTDLVWLLCRRYGGNVVKEASWCDG